MATKDFKKNNFYHYFKFRKNNNNFDKLWRMKTSTRIALKDWLETIPHEQEISNVIANAYSELIENCIKYSLNNTHSQVEIYSNADTIFVDTLNSTDTANFKKMKDSLQIIKENCDYLTNLYIKKINEAESTGISQLGLIKIIMETQGDISIIKEKNKKLLHIRLKMKMQNGH